MFTTSVPARPLANALPQCLLARLSLDLGDHYLKFLYAGLSVLGKNCASLLMTSFPPVPPHPICFSLLQCARSRSPRPIQTPASALYHIMVSAFPLPFLACDCVVSSLAAPFAHFSLFYICPFFSSLSVMARQSRRHVPMTCILYPICDVPECFRHPGPANLLRSA